MITEATKIAAHNDMIIFEIADSENELQASPNVPDDATFTEVSKALADLIESHGGDVAYTLRYGILVTADESDALDIRAEACDAAVEPWRERLENTQVKCNEALLTLSQAKLSVAELEYKLSVARDALVRAEASHSQVFPQLASERDMDRDRYIWAKRIAQSVRASDTENWRVSARGEVVSKDGKRNLRTMIPFHGGNR